MKTFTKIFLVTSVCFIGIILINPKQLIGSNNKVNTYNAFCGVAYSTEFREGKKVFNIMCASCHKLNKKLIGPSLHNVDSLKFWNWITLRNQKIDSTKIDLIGIDYHKSNFGERLTSTQAKELYQFLNEE